MSSDSVTLKQLDDLVERAIGMQEKIMEIGARERPSKMEPLTYSQREAAELIGRSVETIRRYELEGRLPARGTVENGRRCPMTLKDINKAREVFGTRLQRDTATDEVVVLPVQNFKGGSSKTTTCVHLAQYLAMMGLRVLLLDMDSQASATSAFGYLPDRDIDAEQTALPFFTGDRASLGYAIRETAWDGLHLIPANLDLFAAEYHMAAIAASSRGAIFTELVTAIDTIKEDYDVILIDPPPALGMISLNVLYAANALLISMPPSIFDFHSTVSFLRMASETLESLHDRVGTVEYKFMKLLITKYDATSNFQTVVRDLAPQELGNFILQSPQINTQGLDRANFLGRTLYESSSAHLNPKTLKRGKASFDAVNAEVLLHIRRTWPSQTEKLRAEGVA